MCCFFVFYRECANSCGYASIWGGGEQQDTVPRLVAVGRRTFCSLRRCSVGQRGVRRGLRRGLRRGGAEGTAAGATLCGSVRARSMLQLLLFGTSKHRRSTGGAMGQCLASLGAWKCTSLSCSGTAACVRGRRGRPLRRAPVEADARRPASCGGERSSCLLPGFTQSSGPCADARGRADRSF